MRYALNLNGTVLRMRVTRDIWHWDRSFPDAEVTQNLTREMTNPTKTQRKSIDDILRDRASRLTQRVLTDQRHLEKIGREVKGIKRIASKHAKRHR